MTIRAYQEVYLNSAMGVMGNIFDYAVNDCKISGNDFIKMFLVSGIATKMENGEAKYLAGKSGIEVTREIYNSVTGKELTKEPIEKMGRTAEYWVGWAIAYYQWYSSRRYAEVFRVISFDDLIFMYPTLHEADITKFVDIVDKKMNEYYIETNLKRLRSIYGCSQSELAKLSGVSLRSIQMFEQRQKDINNANVSTLLKIAKILGCSIEDLLER